MNIDLKELDIEDIVLRNQTNKEIIAELTKTDSRPDNLAVYEDASVDEAVLIDI